LAETIECRTETHGVVANVDVEYDHVLGANYNIDLVLRLHEIMLLYIMAWVGLGGIHGPNL